MKKSKFRPGKLKIAGTQIASGQSYDIALKVSETYSGAPVSIPMRVISAELSGPTVFVSAAVHGDELNGVGIIRELLNADTLGLNSGILILVPVVNIFGFEHISRYMPDRRDLNRFFPGHADGSLAARLANRVYREIIRKSNFGIDLHTATSRRTNFPIVRGDLRNPEVARIAEAFGCELIVHKVGPQGSLRRAALKANCPTITVEAGEPGKIEPAILELGVAGVKNVLRELGMLAGEITRPPQQLRVDRTKWLRAVSGGLLQFHVKPGEFVESGRPICTISSLLRDEEQVLTADIPGIVIGITTAPIVKPGEAVCHLAQPTGSLKEVRALMRSLPASDGLHRQVRQNLASSIVVFDAETKKG